MLRAVAEPKRLWPAIVVVQGVNVGLELVLREERTFLVGRGTTSDLELEDVDVSRAHVEILRRGDAVLLRDLGSTRGTFLGRSRLDPRRKALWTRETMVRIGRTVLALASPAWTSGSTDTQRASEEVPAGTSRTKPAVFEPSPSTSDEASPPPEHDEAIVAADVMAGGRGAIAEIPSAEPTGAAPRTHVFHNAFVVAMLAIVGLAVAGLVWVLWP